MKCVHNALSAAAMLLAACGGSSGETASTAPPGSSAPPPTLDAGASGGSVDAGAGVSADAGSSVAPGEPIVAPAGQWTWVDVPGSSCADGTATGFGVNLASASDDVLIFLEGGGACWDGASCWGPAQTAFYVATGYGAAELATDPQIGAIYTLNRADTSNPFRDKNLVYVPYCTGDSFSGDNVVSLSYLGVAHDTHFVGYRNLGRFLERIVATFPKTKRVWLSGDSAGGFGAAFNFGRVADAFPGARVDVLDDSGQPIAPDPARWALWKSAWNMQLPAGCTACADGPGGFVDYYRAKYPGSRFGLVSFAYDTVISPFMNVTLDQFHTELYATADHIDATWPTGRSFVLAGASHVGLATPTPELKDWVTKMVTDDPAWGSSRP